jgi:hypothetical protein
MRIHIDIAGTSKRWGFFLIAVVDLLVFDRIAIAQEASLSTSAAASSSPVSEGPASPESMFGHSENGRYRISRQLNDLPWVAENNFL